MSLLELRVSHFRNLEAVHIHPAADLNFLYGVNGSGKTSLLEAVSVLAHGRSFRTRKFRRLIGEGAEGFTVFGTALARTEGRSLPMGVSRNNRGEAHFRVAGNNVRSSTELAVHLPLLVLNADSFGLLTGPPQQRRQFFDWLVFHVKQEFRQTWRQYVRCVKQRNSLLRHDKITYFDVKPWDREIARLSRAIEKDRVACIEPFLAEFRRLSEDLDLGRTALPTIDYQSGWKTEDSYEQQLEDAFPRDRRLGYTSQGPHKSDLKIKVGGVAAGELLSRGQQKSAIAALYIAEARTFAADHGGRCVFLIDDMPAELDADNMARVGRWINNTPAQVFVTSVEYEPVAEHWPDLTSRSSKVFHVKQGKIVEVADGRKTRQ